MARDIAAGKVQAGDIIRSNQNDPWQKVTDVERDGEAVVLVFAEGYWRVHPLRRVAVNRKDED